MLALMILTAIFYPYDYPIKLKASFKENDKIDLKTMICNFRILSVLGCIFVSMYSFSGKDPIMEPVFLYYYGINRETLAQIAMIEGATFIVGIFCISLLD